MSMHESDNPFSNMMSVELAAALDEWNSLTRPVSQASQKVIELIENEIKRRRSENDKPKSVLEKLIDSAAPYCRPRTVKGETLGELAERLRKYRLGLSTVLTPERDVEVAEITPLIVPTLNEQAQAMSERKHSHYFRDVSNLSVIDIYRFLELFNVRDNALGHAIKKLIVPGMRGGGKPAEKDVQEAIDTLQRWIEMRREDSNAALFESHKDIAREEGRA